MGCLADIGYMRSGRVKSAAGVGRRWAGRRPGREWHRGETHAQGRLLGGRFRWLLRLGLQRCREIRQRRLRCRPCNPCGERLSYRRLLTLARRLRASRLGVDSVEIKQRLADGLGH